MLEEVEEDVGEFLRDLVGEAVADAAEDVERGVGQADEVVEVGV